MCRWKPRGDSLWRSHHGFRSAPATLNLNIQLCRSGGWESKISQTRPTFRQTLFEKINSVLGIYLMKRKRSIVEQRPFL